MTVNISGRDLLDYLNLARARLVEDWCFASSKREERKNGYSDYEIDRIDREIEKLDNLIHEVRNHPDFLK